MKNEIIKKITSVFLIVVFVLIITVPLIFINKDPNKISVLENKKLASFPKFYTENLKLNRKFINEFESYINDNIGFKQQAVVGDIVAQYKLFNKLNVPNFIMGEDDNVFYTSSGEGIKTYQGKNLYSKSALDIFSNGFTYMNNYFEDAGAKLYVTAIPDKEGVYPELYSKEVIQLTDNSRVDILVEYMNENTGINIQNLKQSLIDNKDDEMLYFKSHDCTHWNMNGAFVGYSEIMNQIKNDYPALKILVKDDFNINIGKSKGSLVQLSNFESINNAMSFDDDIYLYNLKDGYKAELSTEPLEGIEINANDKFFHYTNKNSDNDYIILIIGDSYMYSFLLPVIAESFNELYFINFTSAQQMKDIQNEINADIVLFEFVERVFDIQTCDKLLGFKDMKAGNISFNELPFVENAAIFNIDSPVIENNVIKVEESQRVTNISGWAIDVMAENIAKDIYAKVGDNYYLPKYVARPDIASANEKLLMSGFTFEIPNIELIKCGHIEFSIISNDGTHQYRPIGYSIEKK